MRKKQTSLFWPVVALAVIVGLVLAVAGGTRSAIGRHYDLVAARDVDPYHQALALNAQVTGDGGGSGWLPWAIVGFVALLALMYVATPFLREGRLMMKAARRGRSGGRRSGGSRTADGLPVAPSVPVALAMTQTQLPAWASPEDGVYEDAETAAPPDRGMRPIERWSGHGR